ITDRADLFALLHLVDLFRNIIQKRADTKSGSASQNGRRDHTSNTGRKENMRRITLNAESILRNAARYLGFNSHLNLLCWRQVKHVTISNLSNFCMVEVGPTPLLINVRCGQTTKLKKICERCYLVLIDNVDKPLEHRVCFVPTRKHDVVRIVTNLSSNRTSLIGKNATTNRRVILDTRSILRRATSSNSLAIHHTLNALSGCIHQKRPDSRKEHVCCDISHSTLELSAKEYTLELLPKTLLLKRDLTSNYRLDLLSLSFLCGLSALVTVALVVGHSADSPSPSEATGGGGSCSRV